MKLFSYLTLLAFLAFSCNNSSEIKLISSFGEQPNVSLNAEGDLGVVFGDKESIYFSTSKDQGDSFNKPLLVAELKGLMLGYSSGPDLAMNSDYTVVTAPSKDGNLYSWSCKTDSKSWLGPFRVNDLNGSVGESLSAITSTPDGKLYCVWIDTRAMKEDHRVRSKVSDHKNSSKESNDKMEEDLDQMTPIGITKGELYKKIGDVPENAILAFHDNVDGKLLWVLFDKDKNVLKAENLEAYNNFRERNKNFDKPKGKIFFASSVDGGKTWSKSKLIYHSPGGSVCECCKPSIISDDKGNITVMFRNNLNGSRDLHYTQSFDGGNTFSQAEKLGTGTWKINGCPMDGGGLIVNNKGELKTVWQRNGAIIVSNSSVSENMINTGRLPSISANGANEYIVFTKGEDVMMSKLKTSEILKIGTGTSPKVIALKNGSIYFWVNSKGLHYKKI